MAQKPLFKSGKKKPSKPKAANNHGKIQKTQKGSFNKLAKKPAARQAQTEHREISKMINRRIEETAASAAVANGLKLSTVRGTSASTEAGKKK